MQVVLLPVGSPDGEALTDLADDLRAAGLRVEVAQGRPAPEGAYDRRRDQHRAEPFLDLARRQEGDRVLAVTDVDLYAKPLNFVFGQAEMGGRAAVISLHRLRAEAPDMLRERVLKEAVHELGHTQGLEHCPRSTCVMHFSRDLGDTDRKGPGFCRACARRFGVRLRLPPTS